MLTLTIYFKVGGEALEEVVDIVVAHIDHEVTTIALEHLNFDPRKRTTRLATRTFRKMNKNLKGFKMLFSQQGLDVSE